MKTPREIRPEIDEIVGFAAHHESIVSTIDPEHRYRKPPDDRPFVGRITHAAGHWSRHLGIVARTIGSNVVMVSGGHVTYWENVGVRVILTQEEITEFSVPNWDLYAIAKECTSEYEFHCECQSDPTPIRDDDGFWAGGHLAACAQCRCYWHRIFPAGNPMGEIGPYRRTGSCVHQLTAQDEDVSWDGYLSRIPDPAVESKRIHDGWNGPSDFGSRGISAYSYLESAVQDHEFRDEEIKEFWPENADEYHALWVKSLKTTASEFGPEMDAYLKRAYARGEFLPVFLL